MWRCDNEWVDPIFRKALLHSSSGLSSQSRLLEPEGKAVGSFKRSGDYSSADTVSHHKRPDVLSWKRWLCKRLCNIEREDTTSTVEHVRMYNRKVVIRLIVDFKLLGISRKTMLKTRSELLVAWQRIQIPAVRYCYTYQLVSHHLTLFSLHKFHTIIWYNADLCSFWATRHFPETSMI